MSGTVATLFEMYAGNDVAFEFQVKDEEENPVDITGWTISTTMKLHAKQSDSEAAVAVDTVCDVSDNSTNGIVSIFLPKEQTSQLLNTKYLFEIQRSYNGFVSTVIYGRVNVTQGITQRNAS